MEARFNKCVDKKALSALASRFALLSNVTSAEHPYAGTYRQ